MMVTAFGGKKWGGVGAGMGVGKGQVASHFDNSSWVQEKLRL